MRRRHLFLLPALLVATAAAGAQGTNDGGRGEGSAGGGTDAISVRAEYASTLLQARRYGEAAAEYRRLLARQPGNFNWRLNRARALAWGGAYRDAEGELRVLASRSRGNTTVEDLLRSVRANITPSSREARAWVNERPSYTPYQLALARAYVREHHYKASYPHFDVVLSRQPSATLYGEAADARVAGRDKRGAVILYQRALERAPGDATIRRGYAAALAANKQYAAAIDQYTQLYARRPGPSLLSDRADVRRRAGDEAGAERDLQQSLALMPTPEAYLVLGDIYRSREQYARARESYVQAAMMRPRDGRLASRIILLQRAERPGFGFASSLAEYPGVTIEARAIADNAGFAYASGGGRVGYAITPGTVIGIGVEPQFVSGRTTIGTRELTTVSSRVGAIGVSAGFSHTWHGENVDARVAGRGGTVKESEGMAIPLLAGTAIVSYRGAWSFGVEGHRGPAWADLMAVAPDVEGSDFPERSAAVAVAATAPLGRADVGAEVEHLTLDDGNARTLVQASLRMPLVSGISLLYTGASLGFSERSSLYWDPRRYTSHALGLEMAMRSPDGVAFVARVLPGLGRADDGLTSGNPRRFRSADPLDPRFVGQVAASADLDVRRGRWRTAVGAAYGSGRGGGYHRFDGTLRLLFVP